MKKNPEEPGIDAANAGRDSVPDAMSLRAEAPLLDGYLSFIESHPTPFTTPGHKGRAGLLDKRPRSRSRGGHPPLRRCRHGQVGPGLAGDAQERSAKWFNADWCRYSPGGSTHCNQALCLSLGRPGDKVVVTRSLHRSLLLGMVLADLEPCWLPTKIDPVTDMPLGVAVEDVESALQANPDARAVLVTEPGYLGTLSDLALDHRGCPPLRRARDRRPGVGRPLRLPPGGAPQCHVARGRRHGDEHPQAPSWLHPGEPGLRPHAAAGSRPARPRL